MSKTRPRSKIDTEYRKNLKYPDINDYLKDTYYSANLSNFNDNQARTPLILRQQDNTLDLLSVTIAGSARDYYLNSYVFYGYNPELESVSHCRLIVNYLDGETVTYQKEFRRDEDEGVLDGNRLQVVSTSFIDAGVNRVVNFGIFMGRRTIRNILEAIFNKHAVKAFRHYFVDDLPNLDTDENDVPKYNPERLRNFVDNRLYRLKIPVTIEVYYFDSEDPAATISTELSFGGVLQSLLGQIRTRSTSIQVNPFLSAAYEQKKFFNVSLNTTIPVQMMLGSKVDSTTRSSYSLNFNNRNRAQDLDLCAFVWAKAAHSDFRVTYPKLEFWVAGWKIRNNDALINDYKLLPEIPLNVANAAKFLTIKDYFIGHEPVYRAGSSAESTTQRFRIRLRLFLPEGLNHWYPIKFQIEFTNTSAPERQYLLLAGDVSNTPVVTSEYKQTLGVFSRAVRYGEDSAKQTVSMMSVKAVSATSRMLNGIDHKFFSRLIKISNTLFDLELTWPDTQVDLQAFTLAAELDRISVKISNYFQQPIYTGTVRKSSVDVYTERTDNPFYMDGPSALAWYPRFEDLKINGRAATRVGSFINLASVPNLTSLMHIGVSPRFYKVSSTTGDITLSCKLRLNCRSYFSPNSQRSFFSPDVFFPLNAVVVGSYKLNNRLKITAVGEKSKIIFRLDNKVTYSFNTSTNEIEVTIKKAKVLEWLNLLVGNPNKNSKRQFYLFLNISNNSPANFSPRYVGGKPSLGAVVVYEV